MALTAYPTVVFNSSTGSDTAASGAGPSTALSGTAGASTVGGVASTTVTLAGSPNLSGVATDGSAVLWIKGYGFYRIDTVNDGADTVVIETAVHIAGSVDWAIGGKRATWDNADSRVVFLGVTVGTSSGTGQGGAGTGWTVRTETDQPATSTGIPYQCTSGDVIIEGDSTTTRRLCNQSANNPCFVVTTQRPHFRNLKFSNSNVTKTSAWGIQIAASVNVTMTNCVCGDATNTLTHGIHRTSGTPAVYLYNTACVHCLTNGISGGISINVIAEGCNFSRNGGIGISANAVTVARSIIVHNGTNGITALSALLAKFNTFHGNGAKAAELSANNVSSINYFHSNLVTGHSSGAAIGLHLSGSTPHQMLAFDNVFNGNGTDCTGITLDASNQIGVDPGYVDGGSSVMNYTPTNPALAGDGFPANIAAIGGFGASITHLYPGAVQPAAAVAGGPGFGRGALRGGL